MRKEKETRGCVPSKFTKLDIICLSLGRIQKRGGSAPLKKDESFPEQYG